MGGRKILNLEARDRYPLGLPEITADLQYAVICALGVANKPSREPAFGINGSQYSEILYTIYSSDLGFHVA